MVMQLEQRNGDKKKSTAQSHEICLVMTLIDLGAIINYDNGTGFIVNHPLHSSTKTKCMVSDSIPFENVIKRELI